MGKLYYPDLICWAGQTFNNQSHSLDYLSLLQLLAQDMGFYCAA
jgi:hypothetical protein